MSWSTSAWQWVFKVTGYYTSKSIDFNWVAIKFLIESQNTAVTWWVLSVYPIKSTQKDLFHCFSNKANFWINSSLTLAVRLSVASKLPTRFQSNHAMMLEHEDQSSPQKLVMSFWNEIRSSDTNPTAVISPKRPWTAASIPPPTLWPSACFLWWSFPCALCGLCSSGWRSRSLRKCCLPWR